MTEKEIERLTDRFAAGDITPDEQEQLMAATGHETPPEGFDTRLEAMIDALDDAGRHRSRIGLWRTVTGIAASLALIVSIGTYLVTTPPATAAQPLQDTCATPEEAYAQTQRALLIFARAIEKGGREIEKADSATTVRLNTAISRMNRQ